MMVIIEPEFSRMDQYGASDRPVVYYGVSCHGWERSITECTRTEYLHFTTCSLTYPAGVLCTDGMLTLIHEMSGELYSHYRLL